MSELMISPTPAQAPSGTGNVKAPNRSDAASRSEESAKTDTGSSVDSPFAAALKSKMDKKTPDAEGQDSTATATTVTEASTTAPAVAVDIAALLPLLGVNPQGSPSAATTTAATIEQALSPAVDEKGSTELQATTEQAPTTIVTALPTAPPPVVNTGLRKLNTEARSEAAPSAAAVAAKPDPASLTSGKITADAAITADTGHRHGESTSAELSGTDFHALMERAGAVASNTTSSTGNTSSSASLRVDTPFGQAGWHDDVGQKLTWMVGNNRQQADLVLNPPQLGRIEVSLTMNGDQATAIFTSSNPAVREALESSLHRLREVLADAGVNLGQTQVGSESPNSQSGRRNENELGTRDTAPSYASPLPMPGGHAVAKAGIARSMIDVFA